MTEEERIAAINAIPETLIRLKTLIDRIPVPLFQTGWDTTPRRFSKKIYETINTKPQNKRGADDYILLNRVINQLTEPTCRASDIICEVHDSLYNMG